MVVGWKSRVGIVLSIAWLCLLLALADEGQRLSLSLGLGFFPLVVMWGVVWAVSGWLSQRRVNSLPAKQFVSDGQVQRTVRTGWVLLAASLTMPFIMAGLHIITAYESGQLVVQLGFGWIVAAVVVDLILRTRPALTKAKGRVVVASGLLAVAVGTGAASYQDSRRLTEAKQQLIEQFMGTTVEGNQNPASQQQVAAPIPTNDSLESVIPVKLSRASSTDKQVAFMAAIQARAKAHIQKFSDLDRRFNATDLSPVLTPVRLTTGIGVQESRKAVAQFHGLVIERNAVLQKYLVDTEAFFRTADIDEEARRGAIEGFNSNKEQTKQLYADLGKAQLASLKTISDMLDFAERVLGRTSVQSGQIMFQTQAELDEYQRLFALIQASAVEEDATSKTVLAYAQKSRQVIVDEYKK